jgi:hypothetical protein
MSYSSSFNAIFYAEECRKELKAYFEDIRYIRAMPKLHAYPNFATEAHQ